MENCDTLTKLFYIIYDNLLTNNNQNKFINNFCELFKKFNFKNFNKIINVKTLILNLKAEFQLAYKICILAYIRCDIYYKINKFIKFDSCDELHESNVLEIITKEHNELLKKYNYITAFKTYDRDFKINDTDINANISENKTENTNNLLWEHDTRNEIINNLILIVEYYTINVLKTLDVECISYGDVCDMTFIRLSNYYKQQLEKIKKSLKKQKQYCSAYIEVEKSFIMTLLTDDNDIYFDDFDVVVESTDDDPYNIGFNDLSDFDEIINELSSLCSTYTYDSDQE